MHPTFADSLQLILPHLSHVFGTHDAIDTVREAASWLPALPHGGFECRLDANETQLDLQQSIYTRDGEPGIFAEHIEWLAASCLSGSLHPVWQRLQNFCCVWEGEQSGIEEIWLEIDLPVGNHKALPPVPAIFVGLSNCVSSSDTIEIVKLSIEQIKEARLPQQWEKRLKGCLHGLPGNSRLSHIGLMTSRKSESLRINLQDMPPDMIVEYLQQCGWHGSSHELKTYIMDFFAAAERLTLCLDIGEQIGSRIGIECFCVEPSESKNTALMYFLARLVDYELCIPQKRDALLAWPGLITPSETRDWPDHMISEAILRPDEQFSTLERKLSHVKLVFDETNRDCGILSAKAYFGFMHQWIQTDKPGKRDRDEQPEYGISATSDIKMDSIEFVSRVADYYDKLTPTILKHVGATYQAGLIASEQADDPYRENNIRLGERAGIRPGDFVLDAGCGVGGPSIDLAQNIEGIRVAGLTISCVQASIAKTLISKAGLIERISITVGDFHYLPYADSCFDVALFLESVGYAHDHFKLFSEVYRVLRPGGIIYIKDPFIRHPLQSEGERQEAADIETIYAYRIAPVTDVVKAVSCAGFQEVESHDLGELMETNRFFYESMYEGEKYESPLTAFGVFHDYKFRYLPTFFGEIKGLKS